MRAVTGRVFVWSEKYIYELPVHECSDYWQRDDGLAESGGCSAAADEF